MTSQANTASAISQKQNENLGIVFLVIIIGALLTSALFLAITSESRLIFFSAIVPAIGAFAVICYAIWQGRVRDQLFSLLLGLLLGLLIYGSYQAMRYLVFRKIATDTYQSQNAATPEEAVRILDQTLLEQTGTTGFLGYVRYEMKTGMLIQSTTPPMGPSNHITGVGVLFYWVYDAVIILGGALSGAWWAHRRAFCEHCHRYYGRIKSNGIDMGTERIGWLENQAADEFKRLLEIDHFEQAGALIKNQKSKRANFELRIEHCDSCNTNPVILSAYRPFKANSSGTGLLYRRKIDPEDYDRLTAFANLKIGKPFLGSNNEWLIALILAIVFISGLIALAGNFLSFPKF